MTDRTDIKDDAAIATIENSSAKNLSKPINNSNNGVNVPANELTFGMRKCPILFYAKKEGDGETRMVDVKPIEGAEFNAVEFYKHHVRKLTATEDNALAEEIIQQAANAMPRNKAYEDNLTRVLQTLSDTEPKDATEAKLLLQASVLYSQGLQYLRGADNEDRIPQSEFYVKNAIKLLRLHNETVEALCRYRRRGEQKVVVTHQHVNVEGGGQAVVGTVVTGGGDK